MAAQAAPKLLTIADTAARLGCSEMHVYRLIAAGELEPVDIAQPRARKPKTRISESDLARYIQAKTRPLRPAGMEEAAGVRYWEGATLRAVPGTPVLVRYADDVLALCHSH